MSKEDAIEAMKRGDKVTHSFFSPDEWMTIDKEKILLEDGVRCDPDEFWRYRKGKHWDAGYSIFQLSIKNKITTHA